MPDRRTRGGGRAARLAATVLAVGALGLLGPAAAASGPTARSGPVAATEDPGEALPSDPPVAPDEARAEAEEILSDPAYQAPEARERSIVERIRDWIADRLPEISPGDEVGDGFDLVSYLIVGALLIGTIVGGAYLVARARRSRRAPDDDALDSEVELTALRSPDEWEAEASRAGAAGEHDLAVRAWFRALIGRLAARDLVLDTPGRTAGELLDDLERWAPPLVARVEPIAHLFEDVWFGGRDAGPAESSRAEELVRAAVAAAPRRPLAATAEDDDDGADASARADAEDPA